METIRPYQLSFRSIEPAEFSAFLAFVDGAFERPEGESMLSDFPTALGKENHRHQYIGEMGGETVCAAAVLIRDWLTSEGIRKTACLGSFSTPKVCRGRGYSGALQQWILETLPTEDVDLALLWTDRPQIYRGRGFTSFGQEIHALLEGPEWPALADEYGVREASPADATQILALYNEHIYRAERSLGDMQSYLNPATSRVLVIEQAGNIKAYAAMGKGQDFQNYVHEYSGPEDLVHHLWGQALILGMKYVLIPDGAGRYLAGRASNMQRRLQRAALGRVLKADRFPKDPADFHWAAWGFDSA